MYNNVVKGDFIMKMLSIENELKSNAYQGRGIIIGKSADGKLSRSADVEQSRFTGESHR